MTAAPQRAKPSLADDASGPTRGRYPHGIHVEASRYSKILMQLQFDTELLANQVRVLPAAVACTLWP